jgi:uncharacterized protein (TIGR02246 family)
MPILAAVQLAAEHTTILCAAEARTERATMGARLSRGVSAFALVALAACAGGGGAAPMQTAADSAAVREIGDKYEAAWNAGDAAALAALVTEDYQSVDPNGTVITGRAAMETLSKAEFEGMKANPVPVKIDIMPGTMTFPAPTIAVTSGTWTLTGIPAGMGPEKGSYLAVSTKGSDGTWRMQSGLAAAYVPPPAMPPAAPAAGKGGLQ